MFGNIYTGLRRCMIVLLVCGLLTAIAPAANAGTPITDDMANSYYGNCINNRDQRMSADTQDIFCQCTAMTMMQNMTVEDIQNMAGQTQAARNAVNKMLINVYAPCMEFPVRDLVYNECQEDRYQAESGICGCLSSKIGTYLAESAGDLLKKILAENPNITDPMAPIVNSQTFKTKQKTFVYFCARQR